MKNMALRLFVFLCCCLSGWQLVAAEMIVREDLHELPMDATLTREEYQRTDLSGNTCALVRIKTDITNLNISSNRRIVGDPIYRTGEVFVWLSPNEKQLIFTSDGYVKLNYHINISIESNHVYAMTLVSSGPHQEIDNVVSLTFQFNVEGVAVTLGQKAPIAANSTVVPFRLPKETYKFTFEKEGYTTQTREIELTDDQSVSITMEPGASEVAFASPGIVMIESDPVGADVELNGQKVGTTPYQGSLYAGDYTLTFRKDLYYSASRTFTLTSGETLTVPLEKLKPRFGYWRVTSNPAGATVYLDEKPMGAAPRSRSEIRSGEHSLRLELSQYNTYMENFTIEDGDDKHFDVDLEPNFARLEIDSAPETGAKVFIDGNEVGTTPWINECMDAGTYLLRVEKPLWSGTPETVTVTPGRPVKKTLVMTKDFGTLIVYAPNSRILLDEQPVGSDEFERNLAPGSYTVTAQRERHEDDSRQVYINIGQTKEVALEPRAQLGSVAIFAVEKRNTSVNIGNAEIHVDGEDVGKTTPSTLELLYGSYNIQLTHPQYLSMSQTIQIEEGKHRDVTFEMDTYSGSRQAKRNFWRTQGWIGLTATAIAAGGGYYFGMQADGYYDDYQAATTTADAESNRDNVERNKDYRNYCYYAASGLAIYTLFDWIMTAVYSK